MIARITTIAALFGVMAATPAMAQQQKMRVADSLPVGHFFAEYGTKFWMAEVERMTNGKVGFEYYPSEQLGKAKDLLSLTQTGVADIGYVVPSYVSEKMPLSAVAELPGSFATGCAGTLAYYRLATGDGILAKREFAANNVRMIFTLVLPPYQVFTGKAKLDGHKSLNGLKLRTAGGAMDATVRAYGGVPVRMAAPEIYESLSRGTIDGMLLPYASVVSYDLAGLTKFSTTDENFGSAVLTYLIGEAKWKKLAPDVQAAIAKAGEAATRRACEMTDREVQSDIAKIRAKGTIMGPFPAAEKQAVAGISSGIAKEWADSLDKRGKPGSDVLAAYRKALAEVQK
ncbi:MAG: TRAP transporter substrate-binding protein DctP [Ferrovibrio sp.]|uniref:TRAP transporter substrate-binding protein n=1 Tax=Ferrovibrio sp. TaxID=1917215 RepID=UPI0026280285|nr:TRAP transporter substrate-binding protein DctP [Ferrovibrio sp.]MCW0234712.1 TRAP transporter substrate-binding protein DctP [Ferrovibrio sp.]